MFQFEHPLPVQLRKLALSIGESVDGEMRRLCESTFRLPLLTHAVAKAMQPIPVARHCFRDELPLWEVNDVKFAPPSGLFTLTLRTAPDAPEVLSVPAGVTLVRVWRAKEDKRDLSLEFKTSHEIQRGDARDLADLLSAWEVGRVYVTFEPTEPGLAFEDAEDRARVHDAAARLGELGAGATLITPEGEEVAFTPETAKQHRAAARELRKRAH